MLSELFMRGKKLILLHSSYNHFYQVPKDFRLSCTHFLNIKFQKIESFNKSHLIIHRILNLKTLYIFTKNILQNHILF